MSNVSIIGGSGYTGGELLRLLLQHPKAEVAHVISKSETGKEVFKVHPNLRGSTTLKFENLPIEKVCSDSEIVFTATPNGVAMTLAEKILDSGCKLIDISADFRFSEQKTYEETYGIKHSSPHLLKEAIYGLPELFREKIKKAKLIANPGCYATASILACAPLVSEKSVEGIIVDAKSGTSGAGADPSDFTHHSRTNENLKAYKLVSHRHLPEIKTHLKDFAGKIPSISFTPHLLPSSRGILATVHALSGSALSLQEKYTKFYSKEFFVKVMEKGEAPEISSLKGSNFCYIGGFEHDANRTVVLSALDNLVKGASGQAVQNMNILLGIDETTGLKQPGIYP